ncbi:MAG: protein-glutamate O-methyltransferase CheR [Halioglobus sp.]|nr:protein-glutamate O-methyltransferase CheR [Halioglobus sp.]
MNAAASKRPPELGSGQLELLMQKLHTHAGIRIDSTRSVIAGSIQSRMAYLGLSDVGSYLAIFDESIGARAEWLALIDLLTVKETRFFRQPEAYECLAQYVDELLCAGPTPSELSFWSAGCSHGQELYSMAMVVESAVSRHTPWLQWHGIGTDISFNAIRQAQQAIYPEEAMRFIPAEYCDSYMDDKLGGRRRVTDAIRARTHFFHSNLLHVDSAPFADFNIIFCQNTLIYFERERQRWIIDQLVKRLRVGGLLILGAGEDVSWLGQNVHRLEWPGVCAYKKTGG